MEFLKEDVFKYILKDFLINNRYGLGTLKLVDNKRVDELDDDVKFSIEVEKENCGKIKKE